MAELYYQDAEGVHHKVEDFADSPRTGQRTVAAVCGLTESGRGDHVNEANVEPGGARCPKCFGKGK